MFGCQVSLLPRGPLSHPLTHTWHQLLLANPMQANPYEVTEGKSRERGMGFFNLEIKTIMNQGSNEFTWAGQET